MSRATDPVTDDQMYDLIAFIANAVGGGLIVSPAEAGLPVCHDYTIMPNSGPWVVELEIGSSRVLITIERR
jgi:hypothetical protein